MARKITVVILVFIVLFSCRNRVENNNANLKKSDAVEPKKDSTIQEELYSFDYVDGGSEEISLIPYNFTFTFDSVRTVRRKIRVVYIKGCRKANNILTNQQLRRLLQMKDSKLFLQLENEVKSNCTFLIDDIEFSLPIIGSLANYKAPKDSTEVFASVIITRIYKEGKEFSIIPVVEKIQNVNWIRKFVVILWVQLTSSFFESLLKKTITIKILCSLTNISHHQVLIDFIGNSKKQEKLKRNSLVLSD